jgi:hypothetical protein
MLYRTGVFLENMGVIIFRKMKEDNDLKELFRQLYYDFSINYCDIDLWDKQEIKSSLEDLDNLIHNIMDMLD